MTTTSNDRAQPLVGFRTNEEWRDILAQVATMIDELERVEDPEIRRKVFAALQAIDAVHREALHRLVRLFKEGVLDQVVTDPAIHTLMGMYDLLPAKQAANRRAIDFLTPEERAAGPTRPTATAAPRMPAELLSSASFALSDPQPHWARVPLDGQLADGEAVLFETDEGTFVIAKVESTLFALDAVCPMHLTVMTGGALKGFSWLCPHGPACVYDIRNGSRLGGGPGLKAYPVRSASGRDLQIGFGMEFEPKLPAF